MFAFPIVADDEVSGRAHAKRVGAAGLTHAFQLMFYDEGKTEGAMLGQFRTACIHLYQPKGKGKRARLLCPGWERTIAETL
jgi:hypothetical protein